MACILVAKSADLDTFVYAPDLDSSVPTAGYSKLIAG